MQSEQVAILDEMIPSLVSGGLSGRTCYTNPDLKISSDRGSNPPLCINETKRCCRCGKLLPLKNFNRCHTSKKDGLDYRCKDCLHKYQKKKRIDYPELREERLVYNKNWRNNNRDYKKKKDLERYYKKIYQGKVLGSSNLCEHISKDWTGKPDFKKEETIIEREHNFVLSKGCKWITFNNTGYVERGLIRKWTKQIDIEERLLTRVHARFFDIYLDIVPCKTCHKGVFVLPSKYFSYDYSEDGFLQAYCSNCGVVYDD